AEAAVLRAAFHDRHERGVAIDPGRREIVELLDLGKADVDLRPAALAAPGDELGQSVQRLRAEYHVDIGGPRHDGSAFLARHAAADADDELRLLLFERPDSTEIGKHLLLRLLAHRAGVEQDD